MPVDVKRGLLGTAGFAALASPAGVSSDRYPPPLHLRARPKG